VSGYDPVSVMSAIEVDIDISHSDPTDLYITLTTPQGTELVLWNQGGAGSEDIIGTFPTTLTAVDPLRRGGPEYGRGLGAESLKTSMLGHSFERAY